MMRKKLPALIHNKSFNFDDIDNETLSQASMPCLSQIDTADEFEATKPFVKRFSSILHSLQFNSSFSDTKSNDNVSSNAPKMIQSASSFCCSGELKYTQQPFSLQLQEIDEHLTDDLMTLHVSARGGQQDYIKVFESFVLDDSD